MRISELAEQTGIPVATIKFYVRSGLLHEGRLTGPRQAEYDAGHIARLRLVRALLGPGGLSVAAAARVMQVLDDPPDSEHNLLGTAHHAVGAVADPETDHPRADALLATLGWQVDPEDHDARSRLEDALEGLEDAGFEIPPGVLMDLYAATMREVAEREVAGVPMDTPAGALRYVVLGTVLVEPLLLALRRLAHQDASGRLFSAAPPDPRRAGPEPDRRAGPEPDRRAGPEPDRR